MLKKESLRFLKIILDFDQNVACGFRKLYDGHIVEGKKRGWENMPSYEKTIMAGGTQAFAHYPDYQEVNHIVRHAAEYNSGLKLTYMALEVVTSISHAVIAYLTTRPISLYDTTYNEIKRLGLPEKELICRDPNEAAFDQTANWKIGKIVQMYEEGKFKEAHPVMVDDSLELYQAIMVHNLANPKLHIYPVLHKGIVTPAKSDNVKAMNWLQIRQSLHVMNSQTGKQLNLIKK